MAVLATAHLQAFWADECQCPQSQPSQCALLQCAEMKSVNETQLCIYYFQCVKNSEYKHRI